MTDDDPTGMFHRMYAEAAEGGRSLPWDREGPHPLLGEWARDLDGGGRRALVVGSGLGTDAEFIAERGYDVVAFDVSPTAIEMARERFPRSGVDYLIADLMHPPPEWTRAFDLVVESLTVQSLPPAFHAQTTANIAGTVGASGTLLVIATGRDEADGPVDGPPWPLTRSEVEAFATDGLEPVRIEELREPGAPQRWRAEFRRA